MSLHSFNVNVAAAIYKLSVLGSKKLVASSFIHQELCLKYGLSHQPCDSKLHLLIASPKLVQKRSPNSSFQQRDLHNSDTTNIANERMACARSGPKNKTRPMATESEGQLELRRVLYLLSRYCGDRGEDVQHQVVVQLQASARKALVVDRDARVEVEEVGGGHRSK